MTVIAWDGKTLAADKRSTFGDHTVTTTKIERLSGGTLLGASGASGKCRELRAWFRAGADPTTYPDKDADCDLLAISPTGAVTIYDGSGHGIAVEDERAAIGSGCELALLAMHLGHAAEEAVVLASLFHPSCGNGVDTLELEKKKPAEAGLSLVPPT